MLTKVTLALLLLQATTTPAVKFDSNRAWEHLRQIVALGPRPAGSPAIEKTRAYIKAELAKDGIAVTEQAWDDTTPLGKVHMVNLIATIPGTSPTVKDRLIIAGHYDTKRFREFAFLGANDGGSSAAFLIEMARVLKARRNPLTYELLFLDGEEAVVNWEGDDHTYGSRHYVEVARKDGTLTTIKAMILVDMIGDRSLGIKKESHSTPWLTAAIWDAAAKLNQQSVFGSQSTEIEDDHLPFLKAGVPSVDIIDLEYDAWHTPNDTIQAVSARSLQIVGDVLLAALPAIETHQGR